MIVLFSTFFYRIGLWYLSLLPLAVFVFMVSHGLRDMFKGVKLEMLREKWSLILIWILTMIGLSGILFFIGIQEISVYLVILILNIFLWLGSHVFDYEDGKMIFEIGTRIILGIILGTSLFSAGFFVFLKTLSLLSCLMLGVYAFLQFIIGIFCPVDEKWLYEIAILGIVVMGLSTFNMFYPAQWIVTIGFVMMSIIYALIYFIQKREIPSKQPNIISVRRILAGERIFKRINIPQWKILLYERLEKRPVWVSRILEIFNLGLLISLLFISFWGVFASSEVHLNIWYRLGIALFLVNTFILKRVSCATDISRFSLALVVNFVLYSVLLISGSSIDTVLPLLIVWGFLCQFILFYVDRINITLFSNKDYTYWTVVTCIASVCNMILLCHINLPVQFLFSLIFVYVGIELLLLYYILQFLHERQDIQKQKEEEKQMLIELASADIPHEEY